MRVRNASIVYDFFNITEGGIKSVPLDVITSSYHHALLIRDINKDNPQPWRTPVLLTKEFLQNKSQSSEINHCHSKSSIIVRLNRLNVHRSEKQRKKSLGSTTTKTGWDMTILVLPSFTICNALPFPILCRCWQSSDQEYYSGEIEHIPDDDFEDGLHQPKQSIISSDSCCAT